MLKPRHIALLAAALLCAGCGSGDGSGEPAGWDRAAKVLSTVPSDALSVTYSESSRHLPPCIDSSSVFDGLGLERLRTGLALSLCFNGSTVPVLTLAPIRNREADDSTSALSGTIGLARAKGLEAEFVPDAPALKEGEGALIITPSSPQMRVARRHIGEGRSILDAENFRQAAFAAHGASQMTVMRNSGARRLPDMTLLEGVYTAGAISDFLHTAAQWTTFVPEGDGTVEVIPTPYPAGICYYQMLGSLPESRIRLGEVLPAGTETVVALALPEGFRAAYEGYLDAEVRLSSYRRHLEVLGKNCGKSPLDWEKELDFKEIGLVVSNGHKAVFLRPAKKAEDFGVRTNPYPGFVHALYGSAFRLRDDSAIACSRGWYIIGSEADVQALAPAQDDRQERLEWHSRPGHFVISSSGRIMAWDKNGIRIWNSNQ